MTKNALMIMLAVGLLTTSCDTEVVYDSAQILSEETALIRDYLADNNIEAEEHPNGFYYRTIFEGNDIRAEDLDWVGFSLSVYDLDGLLYFSTDSGLELRSGIKPPYYPFPFSIIVFDSPNKRPLEAIYDLAELIGVGGEVEAFIPSNMAYGLTGYTTNIGGPNGFRSVVIPPNRVIRLIARVTKISQ